MNRSVYSEVNLDSLACDSLQKTYEQLITDLKEAVFKTLAQRNVVEFGTNPTGRKSYTDDFPETVCISRYDMAEISEVIDDRLRWISAHSPSSSVTDPDSFSDSES